MTRHWSCLCCGREVGGLSGDTAALAQGGGGGDGQREEVTTLLLPQGGDDIILGLLPHCHEPFCWQISLLLLRRLLNLRNAMSMIRGILCILYYVIWRFI